MEEFIPILGMIFVLGPIATWAFSVTPIGRALVERLKGAPSGSDEVILEMQDEVDRLNERVDAQDHQIDELVERLDFTERLLSSGRSRNASEEASTPV